MKPSKEIKVVVGIPHTGIWMADFGLCLANLMAYCAHRKIMPYEKQTIAILSSRGSILPRQRLEIIKGAEQANADYLLWLDSDHMFPPQTLHRLLAHGKDIVGVNHVTKMVPAQPTARNRAPDHDRGVPVYTDPDSPDLEKVWRIGCGTLLMNMKAVRAIGHEVLAIKYVPEYDTYGGEDWPMIEAAEKLGYETWIDHRLSEMCEHIGFFKFNHDLVGEVNDGVVSPHARAA